MVRLTTISLSQASKRLKCSILSDTEFLMCIIETLLHIWKFVCKK